MRPAQQTLLLSVLMLLCGVNFDASAALAADSAPQPKFAPTTQRMALSHEYLQKAEAPDFWAMIPYYVPQRDGSACSLASVTMVVNAARATQPLGAQDKLATQDEVIERVQHRGWRQGFFGGASTRGGVTLDQLGEITPLALAAYGVKGATVEVVHADNPQSPELRAKLHAALVENERGARDFILINYDQKVFTNDESVGHISPIAAYDAAKGRVLVMDPDRSWYEPYWVPEQALLDAMATRDPSVAKARGWVHVRLPVPAPMASASPAPSAAK